MLGSSYDNRSINNKTEIDQATATTPYSRGGLLPIHHGDDGGDIGEGRDPYGGGSDRVSPPIFVVWACHLPWIFTQ
jgi:hypothetical protein